MAKRVGSCTRRPDGYYRWYKGRTRFVCGVKVPEADVEDRWILLKKQIDSDASTVVRRRGGETAFRELLSDFIAAMERRVRTGKPTPMAARTLHNYDVDLNEFGRVIGGGTPVGEIGPRHFDKYVHTVAHYKPSGYASKVARVSALFNWAVEMEYLDRVRFGPGFCRPAKREVRDHRIDRRFAYSAEEVAKLIDRATGPMRPIVMLAAAAAMNNSEVASLERACVDLDAKLLDFRRRKTGKVRRVIPLPADVVTELAAYVRPDPADPADRDLFFLTEEGNPYVRMRPGGQANTLTVLFRRLAEASGVKSLEKGKADGRGFKSLRTAWTNLAPPGYREEVELITGHAHGTVLLDSYLEDVGLERLEHVVSHVWNQISTARAGVATPGGTDDGHV